MLNLRAVLQSCEKLMRSNPVVKLGEIDFFRQGTPPGEYEVDAMEELAASVSESKRMAEISGLRIDAKLIV
jgi:hypothetical protein